MEFNELFPEHTMEVLHNFPPDEPIIYNEKTSIYHSRPSPMRNKLWPWLRQTPTVRFFLSCKGVFNAAGVAVFARSTFRSNV
jgi:hypothetical protein